MFNNLRELILSMPTEVACREYLAKQRWQDGKASCPYCGHNKCYVIEGGGRYKCASNKCYKRFKITVGTIMEASNIPLVKWFTAIYLVTAHKKGISSYQLGKNIGCTQKSAWFMLHRIREALRRKDEIVLGETNPVEADETFVGGKFGNMNKKRRMKYKDIADPMANKTTVLGVIERNGELVARVMPKKNTYKIPQTITELVKKNATLITDSSNMYSRITNSYNYHSVNHGIFEYVKEGDIHTNTIEGAFSHFKRMLIGTYHQISSKHTQRYCDEFAYRYNSRKVKDADRFNITMENIEGRLTYKTLIAAPIPVQVEMPSKPKNRHKGVFQVKDGEIIAHYRNVHVAAKETGLRSGNIHRVCNSQRKSAGGFDWIYA
ncbi:MAG: IS1595 family transposase [Ferruginibacter sp.]|nr:IS1595 family transposase [Ferruginibacter sp.]